MPPASVCREIKPNFAFSRFPGGLRRLQRVEKVLLLKEILPDTLGGCREIELDFAFDGL